MISVSGMSRIGMVLYIKSLTKAFWTPYATFRICVTQQQPGPHGADLQVAAQVPHEAAARQRLLLLGHLQAGAAPRLHQPPARQRRHPRALLPQLGPGEAPDLLGEGVHGTGTGTDTGTGPPSSFLSPPFLPLKDIDFGYIFHNCVKLEI